MDLLLTVALDLAFFGVFLATLLQWVRDRTHLARDTALVFASVAPMLVVTPLRAAWPEMPGWIATLASVVLLAQPFLTMRLIENFRPGVRPAVLVSFGVFVVSAAAFAAAGSAPPAAVLLAVVLAFAVVEVVAAGLLVQEARRRVGAARVRLWFASAGTLLFGAGVLIAGGGAAAAASGAPEAVTSAAGTIGRFTALVAGVSYFAGFVPPVWMRHFWQRSVAYDFLRDLARAPAGHNGDEAAIWRALAEASHGISGVLATAVVRADDESHSSHSIRAVTGKLSESALGMDLDHDDLAGTPFRGTGARSLDVGRPQNRALLEAAGAHRLVAVPVGTPEALEASLLLCTVRGPLFAEEDLAVLEVLGEHAARAVQREAVMLERARLVEQLRRINAELAHASAAKSEFLAGMSHELRTPLHAVIGFSELLMTPGRDGSEPDPTVAEYAAHIHGAGLHLLDLINDVLDLAKIEAGRLELQYQEFDVSALLNRTAKTMRPIAARKGVELAFPEPSAVAIEADAARVRQVLFNLLSNAVKFTPTGGRVTASLEADEDEVRLVVVDTGPGIPAEDRTRIFEPFEQSPATVSRAAEGTGLGLAVTRQLVEGHGGRVELTSELGSGSRFTVALPRRRPGARSVPPPTLPRDHVAAGSRVVLVAEDDARAAELVSIHLREAGYTIAVARDGMTALSEAERLRPAAILLDVLLPVLDGWEVLRHLKDDERTCDIPVVIVSIVDEAEIGFALGAVDYLVKPVTRDNLVTAIDRLLSAARPGSDGRRVLAIDDDPKALELYDAKLSAAGYHVSTAAGGAEGIHLALAQRPDAVLLDLLMPGVDGWAVAARLQSEPTTRGVPILVMTSHDLSPADKVRLNGNVRQVLHKGDDGLAGLLEWLHGVTEQAGASTDDAAPNGENPAARGNGAGETERAAEAPSRSGA